MRIKSLLVVSAFLGVTSASMASVTFELSSLINGSNPTGTAPFLRATFTTTGANTVQLFMENLMPTTNFVDNWVFNMNPVTALTFSFVSGNVANSVTQGSNVGNGGNNMKAGLFDIIFDWPTSNSNTNRFIGGETTKYNITGTGITENTFKSFSVQDGGNPGGWYTAAHVQGFGSSGSIGTNTVVPEPASLMALGFGGLALLLRRRRNG